MAALRLTVMLVVFAISPDALRVVYLADATTDDVFELYSAPIATAATLRLLLSS